jgi:catabolite repression protein CreC
MSCTSAPSSHIFSTNATRLLDVYNSYFGEFNCVCWSPDGNYILTGGQDDLVSIWSLPERRLVARFQGHRSWVRAVAFDPWRSDDRNYRFGSVGDDCCLLLWDFNVGMLHAPRSAPSVRHRASISSNSAALRNQQDSMNARLRSDSNLSAGNESAEEEEDSIVHPTEPKAKTPFLRPLMVCC